MPFALPPVLDFEKAGHQVLKRFLLSCRFIQVEGLVLMYDYIKNNVANSRNVVSMQYNASKST